jgi:hypothetical protein
MDFEQAAMNSVRCYDASVMKMNGFELFHDEELDIQIFSKALDDKIEFVFRGTDSITDWKLDFELNKRIMEWLPNTGKVHSGFLRIYEKARSHLIERATTFENVIIVGHSLGGGVATIAAFDMALLGKNVSVATFGSPRVGNAKFAARYNTAVPRTWRFVDPQDPIPRVPTIGFKHVAGMMTCNENGYHAGYPSAYTLSCCCVSAADHTTENYLRSIEKGENRV